MNHDKKKLAGDIQPEVYAVRKSSSGWRLDRRGLFQAAAAAAGAAVASSTKVQAAGCGSQTRAHTDSVEGLAFFDNGRRLASGSRDKTIKIWSWPDGALLKTVQVAGEVIGLATTPDSAFLVALIQAGSGLQLFGLPDCNFLKELTGHTSPPDCIAVSGDGRVLASAGYQSLRTWSLPDGAPLRTFEPGDWALNVAIDREGSVVATGGVFSPNITLWSVTEGRQIKTLVGGGAGLKALSVHPEGRILASLGGDHLIRLWSLPDGETAGLLDSKQSPLEDILFSPDGRFILFRCFSTPLIWRYPELTQFKTHSDYHSGIVDCMALSPDGEFLAYGEAFGLIHFYTMPDLKPLDRCMIDPLASTPDANVVSYVKDGVTYSLPCGSPIPSGAVCTCNCVQGTGCPCVSNSGGGGGGVYWYPN